MKNKFPLVLVVIVLLLVFCCGCSDKDSVKEYTVELPEEYMLITPEDNLRGYFCSDSVLHIEFDNPINNNIDYQLELRKDYRVNVYDENNKLIGTTSFDSISKFIEQDNL